MKWTSCWAPTGSFPGWNSRLDELQAAILSVKLAHLDEDNALRRRWAAFYGERLRESGLTLPLERPYGQHVYHLYVIQADGRDFGRQMLTDLGIATATPFESYVTLGTAWT